MTCYAIRLPNESRFLFEKIVVFAVALSEVVRLRLMSGDDIAPTTIFQPRTECFPLKKNPVYEAIARELDDAGIHHKRSTRGKHEAVEFEFGGERQMIIMPVSPSDWRAPRAARSHVRRVLRQRR
jgi:hypothetical protein